MVEAPIVVAAAEAAARAITTPMTVIVTAGALRPEASICLQRPLLRALAAALAEVRARIASSI